MTPLGYEFKSHDLASIIAGWGSARLYANHRRYFPTDLAKCFLLQTFATNFCYNHRRYFATDFCYSHLAFRAPAQNV